MTIRETTIAKLQQLPEPFLQQVSDFIDFLRYKQQHSTISDKLSSDITQAWVRWFESVDLLEVAPNQPASNYQELLLAKYRQQGLEL
ncbi:MULTISPECIES: DUF2281 domain-containing protein [unclassified Coleofasciculus]|uniref:DUF2281 domain-containing protein n=1 Tax=unclassified Coleofasciculus TaxID=2692782 RepID=UPI00188228C6|nr:MULTISPECIES: DUF2281 domain-containing protein [unclassified Coleofasciculus]MBE9129675.1 hypothetical protein [Coleofasciculus sp. LEGE 07081]MBE9152196.1 hypothetical protein [Coleofasciculus sp. LEGE 07092]